MTPEDLQFANLRENPFRTLPGERVTVWAGHTSLKTTLEKVIASVRNDKVGLTECVALYGELGTGKSHALRYFQTYIEDQRADFRSKCVYLPTLRIADKVTFLEIYRAILQRIGRDDVVGFSKALLTRIQEEVQKCKNNASEGDYKAAHERGQKIEDVWQEQSRQLVMAKKAEMFKVFEQLSQGSDKAWYYISATATKWNDNDLAQLKIAGPIDSDFDAVEHLGRLLNLMCGAKLNNGATYWKAFYLFLDEVEVLADMESKSMVAINQSFRDLLNACPENLCMALGLTGDAALVEGLFSQYLLSRLTREPIPIPSLDQQQAIDFLKDVLRQYRQNPAAQNEWHPFTAEGIDYIVSNTTDKTPRKLFMNCRRVLELAASDGILAKGQRITREEAERFLA